MATQVEAAAEFFVFGFEGRVLGFESGVLGFQPGETQ
jgi:hypothetical protein